MITKAMRKYLEDRKAGKRKSLKHHVYMWRLQQRLDRELENLLFVCKNHREIFLCEYKNLNEYGHEYSREKRRFNSSEGKKRIKTLLKCIMALTKNDVELQLPEVKEED